MNDNSAVFLNNQKKLISREELEKSSKKVSKPNKLEFVYTTCKLRAS